MPAVNETDQSVMALLLLMFKAHADISPQIPGEGLNGRREIIFAVRLMAHDWCCCTLPQSKKTRHLAVIHSDHFTLCHARAVVVQPGFSFSLFFTESSFFIYLFIFLSFLDIQ